MHVARLFLQWPLTAWRRKLNVKVLVALAANDSELEISTFPNVERSFVYKVRKELVSGDDVASVMRRKEHSQQSDFVRMPDFVQQLQAIVSDDPGKSMRSIAKEPQVTKSTIRLAVHEDLRYHFYDMSSGHFMPDKTRHNRLLQSKRLLSTLKSMKCPFFFSPPPPDW